MSALEALDIEAAAKPLPRLRGEALEGDPAVGSEVSITPIDTGRANSSSGVLTYIDATRAGLLHRNDRVGEVVVHFPRFGYGVQTIR